MCRWKKNMDTKICKKCNSQKSINDFYKLKNGIQSWCKKCVLDNVRTYQKSDNGKLHVHKAQNKYRQTSNGKIVRHRADNKRRAKEHNIHHEWTTEQELELLYGTNGICKLCDKQVGIENLTLDHIIPITKVPIGAIYTIKDIQFICKNCNSSKSNKTEKDYSSYIKPRKTLENLGIKREVKILKFDKQLYEKMIDLSEGKNPTFTESEVIFINNLK